MANDGRRLLSILKEELAFLESGGYRNGPSSPWRTPLLFQDSPTCLNFDRTQAPHACRDCVVASLVPWDCIDERFPCRHIPLNDAGYTIDTYCRLGTFEEAEGALKNWLRKKIKEIEDAAVRDRT